ncbi:MAG: S8 family serine peptidase [Isosphaeraceae bacterium]
MTWIWNREPRRPDRVRRRLNLEALEVRNLLSNVPSPPFSFSTPSAFPAETFSNHAVDPIDALTRASQARAAFGVTGKGMTVAVIDTGVNYHHEAFGDGFGPGFKVEGGWDFGDNDADPDATSWQHGTAVAGILASSDPAHPGVAPDANIIALRVFGNDNNGDFNKIANALQWVIDHHTEYGISAVNLSITDGNNYANDQFSRDGSIGQRVNSKIQTLKSLNIAVVSASGNSFSGQQGMGFTAILPDTISVTGTDVNDRLASDAQRLGSGVGGAAATDIAAPSIGVTGPIEGNGFSTLSGTSFAAPQVTGAVVLLQQIYQQRFGHLPKVDDVDSWLKQGADPVTDPVTGITIGRLNILKAAALVPNPLTSGQIVNPPLASAPDTASGPDASNGSTSPPTAPQTPAPPTSTPSDPGGSTPPPSTTSPTLPPSGPTPPPQATAPVNVNTPPDSQPVTITSPSEPINAPKVGTAIFIDGQSKGTLGKVPKGSALDDFLKALGPDASIDRVQVWTAVGGTYTPVEPGTLETAGTVASVFHRQAVERERQRPIRVIHRPRREAFLRSGRAGFTKGHRNV